MQDTKAYPGKMVNIAGPDCAADTGVILEAPFNCTVHSSALNVGHLAEEWATIDKMKCKTFILKARS